MEPTHSAVRGTVEWGCKDSGSRVHNEWRKVIVSAVRGTKKTKDQKGNEGEVFGEARLQRRHELHHRPWELSAGKERGSSAKRMPPVMP